MTLAQTGTVDDIARGGVGPTAERSGAHFAPAVTAPRPFPSEGSPRGPRGDSGASLLGVGT